MIETIGGGEGRNVTNSFYFFFLFFYCTKWIFLFWLAHDIYDFPLDVFHTLNLTLECSEKI